MTEIQKCDRKEHKGLTYRCPRRRESSMDVVCVGCDAESYNQETCGSMVYTVGSDGVICGYHEINETEWNALPEIPKELYWLIMGYARQTAQLHELKRILKALVE